MLVVDNTMTATAMEAEVVLPASLPIETSGTQTSCDRRVQRLNKVFEPLAGLENWQIINKLAQSMGMPLTFKSVEEVLEEIEKINPAYKGLANGAFWGKDFLNKRFQTTNGKGKFVAVPINVSPQSLDKKPYLHSERYFEVKVRGRLR